MNAKQSPLQGGGVHEEFLALCALSTSGELSNTEGRKLKEHLLVCDECRDAKQLFEMVVDEVIPVVAAEQFEDKDPAPDLHWSLEVAEADFFRRVALEGNLTTERASQPRSIPETNVHHFAGLETWRNIWALSAAGGLLAIALGLCVYQIGLQKGVEMTRVISQASQSVIAPRVSDAKRESASAEAEIKERDSMIAALHRQLRQRSIELDRSKLIQRQLAADLRNETSSEEDLIQQRNEFLERSNAAQVQIQNLQKQIDSVGGRRLEDAAREADLEAKVTELTRLLKERDSVIAEEEQFLAHDRDIRELIGARDLLVAEVYDVARTGQTQKPYGRVFYTRGKSLIFYAYDLDQAQGKISNVFQAWGLRGPDRKRALKLGIFYEDDTSKKRWIVKFDDPKILAQIDAVFVTIEPRGGNHESPSGKPFLFAYLNGNPNHP